MEERMNQSWLLIDVPNLAFRAFATTGGLWHGGDPTGTTYGFLRQLKLLSSRFQSERFIFCFDSVQSKRKELCPTYKAARRKSSEEEAQLRPYREEVYRLRTDILPSLGYSNVLLAEGYEADDVIASLVKYNLGDDGAVIVSSDHDLYQLLRLVPQPVVQYLPHKKDLYGAADLRRDYGIAPERWPEVLALAGCPGDGVVGMKGVGPLTAARFFARQLPETGRKNIEIMQAYTTYVHTNLPLVSLPFAGCPGFPLHPDVCTAARRRAVLKRLGFDSLLEDW